MYTIIMNNNKTLTASKRVVLYEGDNLADKIRFLFPQEYNGIDLSECIVRLIYMDLVGEEQSELLEKDDELYKDRLSYKYPIDSKFTRFYGDILYHISFSIMKDEIESEDVLFHTESHTITISPRSDSIAPEEVIPEDSASKILKEVYDLEDRLIELEENGVGVTNAVKYVKQVLTETQKNQARQNINAISEDEVKEIIPSVPTTLPNPNKLVFTGAVESEYDGLEEKIINIPIIAGKDGEDGFSPITTIEETESGIIISIEDKNGTSTAIVNHGENGKDGADGKDGMNGIDGQTPYINENGYMIYGLGTPKSVWNKRKFVAFGTSITRKCDDYTGGYLEVIKNRLGFAAYANKGVSGASLISNGITGGDNILNCIKNTDLKDYDLVMIECGTNDFKLNVPLGTVGIMGDSNFDTTTFCGALRVAIEHILTSYQMKHIVLIASPQRYDEIYDVNYRNSAGCKHIDYVNAIIEIGELYGIPVIDLYRKSLVNALTVAKYTYDGIHPNSMGYMMLGNQIASEISNMACVFDGFNAVWTDTILTLNGQMYDISVSSGYKYKMVMNLNDTLYLYFDNEPLKVHKDANRECFYSDCYRAKNTNNVFGEVSNIINGVNQTDLADGYRKMNKDRTLDQYVISNHNLYYWNTNEIAVKATGKEVK